jgi:ABC-type sulfate transport system permease component
MSHVGFFQMDGLGGGRSSMLATLIIWVYILLLPTIYGFTVVNSLSGLLKIARPPRILLPITVMLGLALLTTLTGLLWRSKQAWLLI